MDKLNQELTTLCNTYGFSYNGDPVKLVMRLMSLLQGKDEEINQTNRKRIEWLDELRTIVHEAPITLRQEADPIHAVRDIIQKLEGYVAHERAAEAQGEALAEQGKEQVRAINRTALSTAELAAEIHAATAELQARAMRTEEF